MPGDTQQFSYECTGCGNNLYLYKHADNVPEMEEAFCGICKAVKRFNIAMPRGKTLDWALKKVEDKTVKNPFAEMLKNPYQPRDIEMPVKPRSRPQETARARQIA